MLKKSTGKSRAFYVLKKTNNQKSTNFKDRPYMLRQDIRLLMDRKL